MHFYDCGHIKNMELEQALGTYLDWGKYNIHPYAVDVDKYLCSVFDSNRIRLGATGTNSGFYGPQGRVLRLTPAIKDFNEKLAGFSHGNVRITNLEMVSMIKRTKSG